TSAVISATQATTRKAAQAFKQFSHKSSGQFREYFMLNKHIKIFMLILAASWAGLPQLVSADEIRLKNGDVITGTIVKKETTVVVFRTTYAGDINVQWSEVSSLSSDKPVHLVLSDGSSLHGP